jgi:hypothetical protein
VEISNILFIASITCFLRGTCWGDWMTYYATNRKVAGSIPDVFIKSFRLQSFRARCGPGVGSSSNGNEYKEYFLGVKAAYTWG